MNIGNWVKREGAFRRHVDADGNERWTGPRWHIVESLVANAAVTRCGNTMQPLNARRRGLDVRDTQPLTRLIGQPQLCKAGCDRPGMVVFNNEEPVVTPADHGAFPELEDDASTANEVAES